MSKTRASRLLATLPLLAWALAGAGEPSRSPATFSTSWHTQEANGADPFASPATDPRIKPNVDFWVKVYTQYDSRTGVLHDAKYIDHIYEILHSGQSVREAKRKWEGVLLSVHHKQDHPETFTPDEKKVFDLFADVHEPNKFLNAAHRKRLRYQLGQKDHFLEGLKYAGRYLPVMEDVFRREGLPVELARLPFVESSFNIHARSKVGASGIFQFMRSTGKLFLTVNDAIDERNDPIRAAEGAAKLLKLNYESLGSWPLAVTAYNHGRKGMMRAVRRVGSEDLGDLLESYRSRTFGFASSNFFPELLASIEVEKHAARYFGAVERLTPLDYYEVRLPDFIAMKDLSRYFKLNLAEIKLLNPGLTDAVYDGQRRIPAGYRLRLPYTGEVDKKEMAAHVFLAGYSQIPGIYKLPTQVDSVVRIPARTERSSHGMAKHGHRSRKRRIADDKDADGSTDGGSGSSPDSQAASR